MTLTEAKVRLKIPDLWRYFDLQGKPGRSCRSPFREDSNASFSVSEDGLLWNDFADGTGGDAVDFLQRATGLDARATCRKFLELAIGQPLHPVTGRYRIAQKQDRALPVFPPMRSGTAAEHEQLARLRHLHIEAIRVAVGADLLRFAEWKRQAAWLVVDPSGHCAQARRMDGLPWSCGAKAITLPGSWASWPIGCDLGEYARIILTEGGPDLLAALHFIVLSGRATDCCPVAMLGATQKIHPEALPYFAGKRVRIAAHADQAGRKAARTWAEQLATVGAHVDAVDCGGYPLIGGGISKDLNDLCRVQNPAQLEGLLPE